MDHRCSTAREVLIGSGPASSGIAGAGEFDVPCSDAGLSQCSGDGPEGFVGSIASVSSTELERPASTMHKYSDREWPLPARHAEFGELESIGSVWDTLAWRELPIPHIGGLLANTVEGE